MPTVAGISVNQDSALTYTAVYAAVRVLAESVASLPFKVYRRQADGGKEPAFDHPAYPVLHDEANSMMTAFMLIETLMGHLATWGNGYAEIVTDRRGNLLALWPLAPNRVEPMIENNQLLYEVSNDVGVRRRLPSERMLHVKGLGFDGLVGYSPVRLAREAIGLGIATERYGSAFFGNDATPGGVLQHPETLEEDAQKALRRSWEEIHRGSNNSHRVAILEEGMTWQAIGLPQKDAQFLETRKFQVTEIARVYRLPPHMIGDLERATFTNIEQQALEFVQHSLRPWLKRWEQECNAKLLGGNSEFFCEFLVDDLLRGDLKSRYGAFAVAITNGWMSRNEARAFDNMNRVDGLDEFLVPMNMGEASQLSEQVVTQAMARILRKETKAVHAAAKRHLERGDVYKFTEWVETFYLGYRDEMIEALATPLKLAAVLDSYDCGVSQMVDAHISKSRGQLLGLVRDNEPRDAAALIYIRMDKWERDRVKLNNGATE